MSTPHSTDNNNTTATGTGANPNTGVAGTGIGVGADHHKPTMGEKIGGAIESLVGKVTKNEAKIEEGEAKKTGNLPTQASNDPAHMHASTHIITPHDKHATPGASILSNKQHNYDDKENDVSRFQTHPGSHPSAGITGTTSLSHPHGDGRGLGQNVATGGLGAAPIPVYNEERTGMTGTGAHDGQHDFGAAGHGAHSIPNAAGLGAPAGGVGGAPAGGLGGGAPAGGLGGAGAGGIGAHLVTAPHTVHPVHGHSAPIDTTGTDDTQLTEAPIGSHTHHSHSHDAPHAHDNRHSASASVIGGGVGGDNYPSQPGHLGDHPRGYEAVGGLPTGAGKAGTANLTHGQDVYHSHHGQGERDHHHGLGEKDEEQRRIDQTGQPGQGTFGTTGAAGGLGSTL